jgi:hypothetical protein
MLNVINLFKEQESRDELCIGTIRDSFAEFFFPGTSTIQTRARYMLFVPWIYQDLEKKSISSAKIAGRARDEELALIRTLKSNSQTDGLIGILSGDTLKRLPSNIYWNGLGVWGIRLFPGEQSFYNRYIDDFYNIRKNCVKGDDKEPLSGKSRENWHQGVPPKPDNFPADAKFELTQEEAQYLKERILTLHNNSLLAKLIVSNQNVDSRYIWEHPILNDLDDQLKGFIESSHNFSDVINGAALLYNHMLAVKLNNDELIATFTTRISEWTENISSRYDNITDWASSSDNFWYSTPLLNSVIHPFTKKFVTEWIEEVILRKNYQTLILSDEAKRIIYKRETTLKRGRSRLENVRALERWSGDSGTGRIGYRWHIAKRIITDIVEGLERGE